MGFLQRLRSFHRDRSGTSFLEAAIILPVVLLIIGGIYDFGRAAATMSAAQKSLRGAVRYLSLLPSGLVCSTWGVTNAKNLALYGSTTAGTAGSELIKGWTASDISLDLPTSCSNNAAVTTIRMSASVPYNSLMWGILGLPGSITMNVEHEERWIGQ